MWKRRTMCGRTTFRNPLACAQMARGSLETPHLSRRPIATDTEPVMADTQKPMVGTDPHDIDSARTRRRQGHVGGQGAKKGVIYE